MAGLKSYPMIGRTFGRLVVISEAEPKYRSRKTQWLCRCECGQTKVILECNLKAGKSQSCGCQQARGCKVGRRRYPGAMLGRTFGRLTVIDEAERRNGFKWWLCECTCGAVKEISQANLRNGQSQSCGCLRMERAIVASTTHDDYRSHEYRIWRGMLNRCTNPKSDSYRYYGGRGIVVCDRWRNSYEDFLADMGQRPSAKLTIERIDNSLGYSPENCVWATPKRQMNNRRNNHRITYGGITRNLVEWSEIIGIRLNTLFHRIKVAEWPIGEALGFEPRIERGR